MMLAEATNSTLRLLTTGLIPGWLGLLICAAASLFVIHQLRRDLSGVKPTRLTRWVLPSLRITIVTLIAWLLCQPVLLIERHWTPPPQVLVVVDSGNSMRVNEGAGDITRQLDALEAVGKQPIAKRNNAASRGARICDAVSRAASSAIASLAGDLDSASTGLPLGPSVGRTLDALGGELRAHADELISARAQLPADIGDKETKQILADLTSAWQLIGASMNGIVGDGAIVSREASKSPSLLDAYLVRVKKLVTDADAARKRAVAVQVTLDKILLTEKDVAAVRAAPVTRESLADMAADRLSAPKAGGPSWRREKSLSMATALDDAFAKSLESPLAGIVLLSDGSSPPPQTDAAGSSLGRLKVPVSTILIGTDGEEPADAGLIAIDVPRVVLAGDSVTLRCLVKNLVAATPAPKLTATVGKDQIGARDLAVTKDGYDIVEFAWTPASPGRTQLVFRIESTQPDAYPGNETSAAVVEVMAAKAHALIVSDRLTGDFAAVSQLLSAMPAVESRSILAAPGLSKFSLGSKSDEFPATAEDFKALSVLVLIGDVPEAAGAETVAAIKQAIDAGLRVWVQAPAGDRSTKSWASALEIETKPIAGRNQIEPVNDLWLDLYQLGPEVDESNARWKTLPSEPGLSQIVTPGIKLLTADSHPILTLVPRKNGSILVCGIGDFAALRGPSTDASVNRLLAESLTLALSPIGETGATGGAGLFPPQPIFGRDLYVIGAGSNIKGLGAVDTAPNIDGAKMFRVTDSQAINIQTAGASISRIVRPLLSRRDFQLAAHNAPLRDIAADTGGGHGDLFSVMNVLPHDLSGTPRSSATRIALWPGSWSLVVLLGLVSAEYLLRRRAGKVM